MVECIFMDGKCMTELILNQKTRCNYPNTDTVFLREGFKGAR